MPLLKGSSPEARSKNIAELVRAGHPQKQAEAIAYRVAGEKPANDMTPEDWDELVGGLIKFFMEEEREPEHASDSLALDKASVRDYDVDGRLHVSATPISKANICEYMGSEIPGAEQMGLHPDRRYRLLRHPDELRRGADTFNNLPLLRRHVPVSAGDHKPDDVIGSTGTDAKFDPPYLMNSLVVWAKDHIDDIEKDLKRELSSAYRYRADMTPGTYENEPYDGVMRDIVGNHVALVKEGRAGPDVVVGDEAIHTPLWKDRLMATTATLSRQALLASGALLAYLPPKLAQDAKIDFRPALAGVTAKNWKSERPKVAAAVRSMMAGKLAKDAKLDDLDTVLLAIDEAEPEEEKEDDKKAKDAGDMPKPGGEKDDGPAKDMKAKDKKGMDKRAMDKKARDDAREEFKEKLKDRMSAEDWKAACDDIDGMEMDEKDDEDERPDPEKTNDRKAKDAEMKEEPKKAMDAAIAGERQRARDVREAERFVRPWIGELALAFDSADEVYQAAVEAQGKSTKGVHPSAYRTILELLPKPGTEHRASARVAMDARPKSFETMFPDAMRIGVNS